MRVILMLTARDVKDLVRRQAGRNVGAGLARSVRVPVTAQLGGPGQRPAPGRTTRAVGQLLQGCRHVSAAALSLSANTAWS